MLFGYQVSHADTTAGEMLHVHMEGSSEAGVDIGRMPVHRDEAEAESRQAWRMMITKPFRVAMRSGDTPVPIPNTMVKT